VEELIALDQKLFLFLNQMGSENYDSFWMLMTNKASNISLYLILAILYFRQTSLKSFLMLLMYVALMILFTDQGTNLFKSGFERLRPCHEPSLKEMVRLVKSNCGGLYGYFSGHASNSFALAVFFSGIFRVKYSRLPFLLLFIAFLVAYSRIYIGVHYPLDVVCGMVFGSLVGVLFYFIWRRSKGRLMGLN
jgi:undecaprenyl-diphosphatase